MLQVDVKPEILRWARERSGRSEQELERTHLAFALWERGEKRPTLKQLEAFAKATYTPIGYFFLQKPPAEEATPIPDLRRGADSEFGKPSRNLLDTINLCRQRQDWYQEHAKLEGEAPCDFVGSAKATDEVEGVADRMRRRLHFDLEARKQASTWTEALRQFISQAEEAGVLVMCSGVVLNNNQRKLNPREFRGFAISDPYAPLVFINGADSKAAQMFTLAHELAHLWLGQSAISDVDLAEPPSGRVERFCDRVAAELLVPMRAFKASIRQVEELDEAKDRLAREFKVSTLVILRRFRDARIISEEKFKAAFQAEIKKIQSLPKAKGGGDFYRTLTSHASRRFARAIVGSALEGHTMFREAFQLLGISKARTFDRLAREFQFIR